MARRAAGAGIGAALLLASVIVADDAKPIPGIGPVGPVKRLHGGFKFVEGPAANAAGVVYFTDIPADRILKVDAMGNLSVVRENTQHTNGLMFNAGGELLGCQQRTGKLVAWSSDGKGERTLAAGFGGQRFNAPNDLVIDKSGGVYMTDPNYGSPRPLPQGATSVYYIAAGGTVSRVVDSLPNPNGVILSPDEKTLYVVPTDQAAMMAYPVLAPGKLGPGRVLCTLRQPAGGPQNTGGDGLTIDTKGNLYITSRLGIQVVDPAGKILGVIATPEQPANCTFGGPDFKTLYITARTSLYAAPMEAVGHRFPGKP